MKGEEIKENTDKINKYSNKTLPKLLIYLGKIKSASGYEDWIKQISKLIWNWFLVVFIIRALLIFICLWLLRFLQIDPLELVLVAEGISLLWYLIIDLKQDLFKRGAKNG